MAPKRKAEDVDVDDDQLSEHPEDLEYVPRPVPGKLDKPKTEIETLLDLFSVYLGSLLKSVL